MALKQKSMYIEELQNMTMCSCYCQHHILEVQNAYYELTCFGITQDLALQHVLGPIQEIR